MLTNEHFRSINKSFRATVKSFSSVSVKEPLTDSCPTQILAQEARLSGLIPALVLKTSDFLEATIRTNGPEIATLTHLFTTK